MGWMTRNDSLAGFVSAVERLVSPDAAGQAVGISQALGFGARIGHREI